MIAAALALVIAGLPPDPLIEGRPAILRGHTDGIMAVAYAPDGGELASVARDKTLRVWNLADGGVQVVPLKEIPTALAYSADGRTLAVGDYGFQIQLFDTTRWAVRATALHSDQVAELQFSPDGARIAVGGQNGNGSVFDAVTGKPLKEGLRGRSPAFSSDGKRLLWRQASGAITVMDAATWKVLFERPGDGAGPFVRATADLGRLLTFNPTAIEARLLTGKALKEAAVLTVAVEAGAEKPRVFWAVADRTATRLLASYHDGQVRLWDVDKKQIVSRWPITTRSVLAAAPSWTQFAVGDGVTIKVWALTSP